MRSARLIVIGVLWVVLTTTAGAANCLQVVDAWEAGYYRSAPDYSSGLGYYLVGQFSYLNNNEVRNWFAFSLPTFPAPLERAELRIYAGRVDTADASENYEVHEVTTPVTSLVNQFGNPTNVYNDLGDGPVYGSATASK